PDRIQTAMVIDAGRLIQRATLWFLRNRSHLADLSRSIEHFRSGAGRVAALFPQILPDAEQTAFQAAASRLEKEGVPRELAARIAATDALFNALDIVEVADSLKRDIEPAARPPPPRLLPPRHPTTPSPPSASATSSPPFAPLSRPISRCSRWRCVSCAISAHANVRVLPRCRRRGAPQRKRRTSTRCQPASSTD